jgi:hypothetical protein
MNHPYLTVGQEVIFVGIDKKPIKGKIAVVYGPESARIDWPNGSAVADHSDKKEAHTFHFEQASSKAESPK